MTEEDKSLGEKAAAAEYYQATIENMEEQEHYIKKAIEDFAVARETLKSYQESADDDEILVPIGGNAYIFASVKENTKVLRGIGNELVLEEDVEKAVESIDVQIEEMKGSLHQLSSRIVDFERKLQGLQTELNGKVQQ